MISVQEMLSNRKYTFQWKDVFHETEVSVEIPDLRNLNFSSGGDWGPMYYFEVNKESPVKISYNGEKTVLENQNLAVKSPMLAKKRETYPFYISVEDSNRDLNFRLYVDSETNLKQVEVMRLSDRVQLFESN